jgi:hypothetical protein
MLGRRDRIAPPHTIMADSSVSALMNVRLANMRHESTERRVGKWVDRDERGAGRVSCYRYRTERIR